jgi:membrane dipeptidase
MAGNARHVALGTDLDGGYGTEQTPRDVSTIADLQKLGNILLKRKYKPADVDAIFYKNALSFLREALPKGEGVKT